jgi:hypothetical protein
MLMFILFVLAGNESILYGYFKGKNIRLIYDDTLQTFLTKEPKSNRWNITLKGRYLFLVHNFCHLCLICALRWRLPDTVLFGPNFLSWESACLYSLANTPNKSPQKCTTFEEIFLCLLQHLDEAHFNTWMRLFTLTWTGILTLRVR